MRHPTDGIFIFLFNNLIFISKIPANSMNNNDTLRILRYTFDFNDFEMIDLFAKGGRQSNREEVSNWLKKDEDPAFKPIYDKDLAAFLNGLIILKRGKKEGEQPLPEKSLNNNQVFRKLKIALALKDEDILEVLGIDWVPI
jgi:uncharacterized protein YehS (DUF1456 family)